MKITGFFEEKFFKDEDGNKILVVKEFPIAHIGWECDSVGYVVVDGLGKNHLILTDHGSPYLADKKELINQVELYNSLIQTYNEVLNQLSDDE